MAPWNTESLRYFPKAGNDDSIIEVSFSIRDKNGENIDINIIEMPDNDLKEIILFKENERDKISNIKISKLYILMTDAESGDKDDFLIAMFIKLLCENLSNLSFIVLISKWDIISEKKFKYYHYQQNSAYDYVKNVMPLTYRMLNSNEILDNSILKHSVLSQVQSGENTDTINVLSMIRKKLEINGK